MKPEATYKTSEHQIARTGNGWARFVSEGGLVWHIFRTNGRMVATKIIRASLDDRFGAAQLIRKARREVRSVNLEDALKTHRATEATPPKR
jgi:hypothetical protein